MTVEEGLQNAIDDRARRYYEADIRVAQGEDPEKVAKELGLDRITSYYSIGGSIKIPIEAIVRNKIESDGRTTLQKSMSESKEKQRLENMLSSLEKANEKKRLVAEKRRNMFIGIGFVIGLFFLLGNN